MFDNKENSKPEEKKEDDETPKKEDVDQQEELEKDNKDSKENPEEDADENKEQEETNKQELIGEIMANDPLTKPVADDEEEEKVQRSFSKNDVIEEVHFSIFNFNHYLDAQFPDTPQTLKALFEIVVVSFLFLLFPMLSLFLENGAKGTWEVLKKIYLTDEKKDDNVYFAQLYIFITAIYIIYVIVDLISVNILYISLWVLGMFRIEVNEIIIEILQIITVTSFYWKSSVICFLVFISYTLLVNPYKWFSSDRSPEHIIVTFFIWYGSLMILLFAEKFFLNFCTAEIRRNEYKTRIWDTNYKTFIFKKLAAISKAEPSRRRDMGINMESDFDAGLFLKHNDLKLRSKQSAKSVAESIFGYLEINELCYEDIKLYFPNNHKEVYEYLIGHLLQDDIKEEDIPPVTYEKLEDEAIKLFKERNDISRTLTDRDSIFLKLDFILFCLAFYVSMVFLAILLSINYQIYLASVGPFIVTFSWIFSDTIKDIYNCFVFLLVKHPYDVGDRVVIDNKEYLVEKTDLLSSTFKDSNGKMTYIPTQVLFTKQIDNIRRSKKQSEEVSLKVGKNTTFKTALKLRDTLIEKLQEHKNYFSGTVILRSYAMEGGDLLLKYAIQHTTNFQQSNDKLKRTELLTNILLECLKESEIHYENSFPFVS